MRASGVHITQQIYVAAFFFKTDLGILRQKRQSKYVGRHDPQKRRDCDPPLYHIKICTHIFVDFCIIVSGVE